MAVSNMAFVVDEDLQMPMSGWEIRIKIESLFNFLKKKISIS